MDTQLIKAGIQDIPRAFGQGLGQVGSVLAPMTKGLGTFQGLKGAGKVLNGIQKSYQSEVVSIQIMRKS